MMVKKALGASFLEVLNRKQVLIIGFFVLLNVCHASNIKRSILTNAIDTDESFIDEKSNVCFGKYLKNFSTRITCIRGESVIDCVDEQIPGDKVIIKCKTGYKPLTNENDSEIERICLESGEWSGTAYECQAKCGLSSSGIPWNAPVYQNKEPICGGTIISEFIVLSAASCFVEETLNGIKRSEITDYDVVVGKYIRDFAITENAKFFKLRNIFIPNNYAGYKDQFDANYAVLTLDKPIVYTFSIYPICIDSNLITVEQKAPPSNELQGIVSGFGYTQRFGAPAYRLQEISLPIISDDDCKAKAPKEYLQYMKNDKFCAGYANGYQGLCIGDDGGSIVVPRLVQDRNLYFIHGIASNTSSIFTKGTCDIDFYSLFTNVLHYAEEIQNEITNSKSLFQNFIN